MRYTIAPLFCRPWMLDGINPQVIDRQYRNSYGGDLNRLNAITEELEALDLAATPAPLIARLKQEQATTLNSVVLQELYFASLGGDGHAVPERMAAAITRDFGAVDRWRQEFSILASAADSGWALLIWLPRYGQLINQCVTDANPVIAGGITILALDLHAHAYELDIEAHRVAHVEAFLRNIDWNAVQARYEDAIQVKPPRPREQSEFADLPSITVDEVKAMLRSGSPVQIIDTRPKGHGGSNDLVDEAVWRDPERIHEWIGELSTDVPVVTFCVYGFHVGAGAARALRDAGLDARYLAGGHCAWQASTGPSDERS